MKTPTGVIDTNKKKPGGRSCAARFCKNASYKCKFSFFRFPKDAKRARTWAISAGRRDLLKRHQLYSTYRLCGAHFERKMFLDDLRNRLLPTAVPTIFANSESSPTLEHNYAMFQMTQLVDNNNQSDEAGLTIFEETKQPVSSVLITSTSMLQPSLINTGEYLQNIGEQLYSTTSTQTSSRLLTSAPREQKLRKKIQYLRTRNARLTKKNSKLSSNLLIAKSDAIRELSLQQLQSLICKFCPNKKLAEFINVQIAESNKEPHGRRYSSSFKQECFEMYIAGPKVYEKVLMELFCLPSPSTLQRME